MPFTESIGRPLAVASESPDVAQGAAPLDALADDGPGLVAAAGMLAAGILQQFGMPEVLQVTRDGERWHRRRRCSAVRQQMTSCVDVSAGAHCPPPCQTEEGT